MDPFEPNMAHFKGWDAADVPPVYYHRIYHGIPASYAGPRFWVLAQDDPPLPLRGSSVKSAFLQGGSVVFSALQLAHYMEANHVLFVGQDFAFADGHTRAVGDISDCTFDENALPRDYLCVPGVGGKWEVSSKLMYSYLLYMQDYLLGISRSKPEVRHINASQTGAVIQGMEYLSLDRALAACCGAATP